MALSDMNGFLVSNPKIGIYQSRALGLYYSALWKFTPEIAGDYKAYIQKFCRAFVDVDNITKHPLDMVKDFVMECQTTPDTSSSRRSEG